MSGDTLNNLTDAQKVDRLAEAEIHVVEADKWIKRFELLKVLVGSPEYVDVFECGYFDEYAQELFSELTNPPQFAKIPFKDCEDLLCGIKAMKSYVGFAGFKGKVEQDAEMWAGRKEMAQSVINAIG